MLTSWAAACAVRAASSTSDGVCPWGAPPAELALPLSFPSPLAHASAASCAAARGCTHEGLLPAHSATHSTPEGRHHVFAGMFLGLSFSAEIRCAEPAAEQEIQREHLSRPGTLQLRGQETAMKTPSLPGSTVYRLHPFFLPLAQAPS
jgi:hypothetical protein